MTALAPISKAAAGEDAGHRSTVVMALGLMSVIAMMVLPVPPFLLDIGLTLSFAFSILIFTIVLFIERPLDFSGFPTVLLASLMLRLALNVSSTRLIIGEGHTGPDAAGAVIHGFAMFVMNGNIFLGLVTFGVIMIVNFMVITQGAGRMAEVGARFALDGMPGKQLAIDSDVAAGAISHEEAQKRRRIEQEETTFFGSLDGASKFVKGDAVAGLLITLLNLVVGMAMGVAVHGLSFADAVSSYSILTVGDGLVSQIPAVVISVAAALLLSKGGASGAADKVLIQQFAAHPLALITVGACLAGFAFVPGLPFFPFALGAAAMIGAGFWRTRQRRAEQELQAKKVAEPKGPVEKPLGDILNLDEIRVEFAPDLIPLALDAASGLEVRVARIRTHVASEYGFITPPVRLMDNADLAPGEYLIWIQGVETAKFTLKDRCLLAIIDEGVALPFGSEETREPVYGAAARWIAAFDRDAALAGGWPVIEPTEILATHLLETVKANFGRLMTRRSMRRILDEFAKTSDAAKAASNRQIIDEFIPEKAPIEVVQSVLRLLLEENVSVRNLPVILEAIADARTHTSSAEQICEYVRRRLGRQLTAAIREKDGSIPLIQLAPAWEETFQKHEIVKESGEKDIALPPEEFNRLTRSLGDQIQRAAANGRFPAVVTFADRRRFIRTVLYSKGIRNPVFSYEEIDMQSKPTLLAAA